MVSAARSTSSLTWVAPAARVISGICYGSPISGFFPYTESRPILVFIKNDSKDLISERKSSG